MDELALIHEAQQGKVDSFNTLVLAYQTSAYNLAYRLMDDPHAAADATQEAFISAYHHLSQFRGGSFKSWLLRIVTNACYDERRHRKRRPADSLESLSGDSDSEPRLASQSDNPEQIAQQNALNRVIQDCLEGLSEQQRLIAVLADVQGYDYQEIAEIAEVKLGTVKSRLSRARQQLRECLQQAGELLPSIYRLNDKQNG